MFQKITRRIFLSDPEEVSRLRKAFNALLKYCEALTGQVYRLEAENKVLREELEADQCPTPPRQ